MAKPFILGINGSPHKDGIVCELLQSLLDGAVKAGAETKLVHLYDLTFGHDGGSYSKDAAAAIPKNAPKDDLTALFPDIVRADGLVLATPVYWANMSGIMKDFIDRLTPLENQDFQLEGKVASFIAASKENEGGLEMAAMSMVTALCQMGVLVPPNGVMWHPGKWVTSKGESVTWAQQDAPRVGRNMVRLVEMLKKEPIAWSE